MALWKEQGFVPDSEDEDDLSDELTMEQSTIANHPFDERPTSQTQQSQTYSKHEDLPAVELGGAQKVCSPSHSSSSIKDSSSPRNWTSSFPTSPVEERIADCPNEKPDAIEKPNDIQLRPAVIPNEGDNGRSQESPAVSNDVDRASQEDEESLVAIDSDDQDQEGRAIQSEEGASLPVPSPPRSNPSSPLSSLSDISDPFITAFNLSEPVPLQKESANTPDSFGQQEAAATITAGENAQALADAVNLIQHQHSLRRRTDIQRNPFSIENARYRSILKGRGIAPVQIAQPSSSPSSQSSDGNEASTPDQRVALPSQPSSPRPQFTPSATDDSLLDWNLESDNELPALPALAAGREQQMSERSPKRRRISGNLSSKHQFSSNTTSPLACPLNLPRLIIQSQASSPDRSTITSPGQILSTAPTYRSSSHDGEVSRAAAEVSVSPVRKLPKFTALSPSTSGGESDCDRDLDRPNIPLLGPAKSLNGRPGSPASTSSNSPSQSGDEAPGLSEVRHVQQRIKGVLPASWLRLDEEKRGVRHKSVKATAKRSILAQSTPAIGVARRPTSRTTKNAPSYRDLMLGLDDDSSDVSSEKRSRSPQQRRLQFDDASEIGKTSTILISDDDEALEMDMDDNAIDYMLTSASKPQTRISKPRISKGTIGETSRYRGLQALGQRLTQPLPLSKNGSSGHSKNFNKPGRPIVRKKGKRRPRSKMVDPKPLHSLLDAVESSKESRPQFLRIARRTAKSRKDQSSQVPSRKVLKMSNHRDTHDVDQIMRQWETGSLAIKVPEGNRLDRQILREVSRNLQQKPSDSYRTPKTMSSIATVSAPAVLRQPAFGFTPDLSVSLHQDPSRVTSISKVSNPSKKTSSKEVNVRPVKTVAGARSRKLIVTKTLRQAQLERLATQEVSRLPKRSLETQLLLLNKTQSHLPDYSMSRFMSSEDDQYADGIISLKQPPMSTRQSGPRKASKPKAKPVRIDIQSADLELSEFSPSPTIVRNQTTYPSGDSISPTFDAERIKAIVATTFDSKRLPIDSFFHSSTFIGSGDFSSLLRNTRERDYDVFSGMARYDFESRELRWGFWNEEASRQFFESLELLHASSEMASDTNLPPGRPVDHAQLSKFLHIYIAKHLTFSDPPDRNSFLRLTCLRISRLVQNSPNTTYVVGRELDLRQGLRLQDTASIYLLLFQIHTIADHKSVETIPRLEVKKLLIEAATALMKILLHSDDDLRDLSRSQFDPRTRSLGIMDKDFHVQSWLILFHTLRRAKIQNASFWELFNSATARVFDTASGRALQLESAWKRLADVLPLLSFDENGLMKATEYQAAERDWQLVKSLTNGAFNFVTQGAGANNYVRSVMIRCHRVIGYWGWSDCSAVLGSIFDFFTTRNLENLPLEEVTGSPSFLQNLDRQSSVSIEAGDKGFAIFLKVVALGLKTLRSSNSKSKDRACSNLVFRIIPNHGRQYPRDKPLLLTDLDALRNHHDLMATLYWAAPRFARPQLGAIERLVDADISHSEACLLSIKTWRNLVRFQLSTEEPPGSLESFARWHSNLINRLLKQHRDASSEAMTQARVTNMPFSHEPKHLLREIDQIVRANETKVESMIIDLLKSMSMAMDLTNTLEHAMTLLTKESTLRIMEYFDARKQRHDEIVLLAVKICASFLEKCATQSSGSSMSAADTSEESQEYGTFAEIEDMDKEKSNLQAVQLFSNLTGQHLHSIVFNVLGADSFCSDTFLAAIVDVWIQSSSLAVSNELTSWSGVIGAQQSETSQVSKKTDQARQFSCYVFAKILQFDPRAYNVYKMSILGQWMSSLVERESMLKYQHIFTSEILNLEGRSEMLANLPFWRRKEDDLYVIELEQFRERRLSLISSLMANMRRSVDEAVREEPSRAKELRSYYSNLIKQLLANMRFNIEELSAKSGAHQGSYFHLVYKVIELQQQYLDTICPVDKYFTELLLSLDHSSSMSDPTLIVGKLKGYGESIHETRSQRALVSYLLILFEQSIRDGSLDRLEVHIVSACSTEDLESGPISLRAFLALVLFPILISACLRAPSAVPFARPIFNIVRELADTMLLVTEFSRSDSMSAQLSSLTALISALANSTIDSSASVDLLQDVYDTASALLPALDYLLLPKHLETASQDPRIDITALQRTLRSALFVLASFFPATSSPALIYEVPRDMQAAQRYAEELVREKLKKGVSIQTKTSGGGEPMILDDDGLYVNVDGIRARFGHGLARYRRIVELLEHDEDEDRTSFNVSKPQTEEIRGEPASTSEEWWFTAV